MTQYELLQTEYETTVAHANLLFSLGMNEAHVNFWNASEVLHGMLEAMTIEEAMMEVEE